MTTISNNFKVKKSLNIDWLLNNSNKGGAMEYQIKNKKKGQIVIKNERPGKAREWATINPDLFLTILNKNNYLYEVICSYPHKLYFDIDREASPDPEYLPKILAIIEEYFPDGDLAISGSVTDTKTSYHIVSNNYLIDSLEERITLKAIVKHLETLDQYFDSTVYTNNREMKCINQSKKDERIQAIITQPDYKKHLITCFLRNDYWTMPDFEEPQHEELKLNIKIEKSKTPLNLGSLPVIKNLIKPENFNPDTATPLEILTITPLNTSFDHKYTHHIARYCFTNSITFDEFISWYQNKSTDSEKITKWKYQWSKLHLFPPVSHKCIITLLSKYYPSIRREHKYEKLIELFKIPEAHKVETLTQDVFNSDEKFVLLNTGMGSGKTFQTIKYLQDQKSFIWMTPIIALAQNTHNRLTQDNIDCKYYHDFKDTKDKHLTMCNYNRIIICINSLHYLKDKKYKVVVVDEIETLLNKWFVNSTLDEYKFDCWNIFINLLKSADKVIFLDAFTSKITLNFIKALNDNHEYKIVERVKECNTRDVEYIKNFSHWLKIIIDTMKEGKKPFIFYPLKRSNHNLPSMEELHHIIQEETGKTNGVFYNADVGCNRLKDLEDVNKSWSKYDFVITNTKITVGINYEEKDFDTVYLCVAGFSSARDIIQVSYRCRHLISNQIKVCYIDNFSSYKGARNDEHLVANCPIYQSLKKDLLIEREAPLKQSISFFCDLAHYNVTTNIKHLEGNLEAYFKKIFEDTTLGYNYETIPNITSTECQELQFKIYERTASLEDKIAIKKYFYNLQFEYDAPKEFLEIGWDRRYETFFKRVNELKNNDNNVFDKIKTFNKWDSIFPSDIEINKVKLSEEIINQIFDENNFKDLIKTSGAKCIIKNFYNIFFEKKIMNSIVDKSHNTKMTIKEEVRDLYRFCIDNQFRYDTDNKDISTIDLFND